MKSLLSWLLGLLKRPRVVVTIILFLILYSTLKSCVTYVAPDEIGIRQVFFGSGAGMQKQPVTTGLRLAVRGVEKIHLFPTDLQVMDMTSETTERRSKSKTSSRGASEIHTTNAIRIQTSEGYAVTVDASVLYRIVDPYRVITKIGPGQLYEDSVVIPRSDLVLRKTLGELNAEEFYDPAKRTPKVADATRQLSTQFADNGMELVKVLVRKVTYDQAYQQQIEKRKIQDQVVFKNQAEAKAAKGDAHKREVIAAGQAQVKVELERGKSEAAKILADADLYARTKAAEADLLVKTARARGTELENEALKVVGSENMVGLQMAKALESLRVVVLPSGPGGFNPLDLGATLRQFDVQNK